MLGATALALFGMCAFLLRVAEPHLTLLYRELELADSSAIVDRRKALGVTFRLQGDGRAILVPADRARRLHMAPAAEGLPRDGTRGDEIFDQQSALGTIDLLANVRLRRTTQGRARAHHRLAHGRARRARPPGSAPARTVPPAADRAERFGEACTCTEGHASSAARCRPPSTWSLRRRPGCRPRPSGRSATSPLLAPGRKLGESIENLVENRLARGAVMIRDDWL